MYQGAKSKPLPNRTNFLALMTHKSCNHSLFLASIDFVFIFLKLNISNNAVICRVILVTGREGKAGEEDGEILLLSGLCRNREGERIMKTLYIWETNEKSAKFLFFLATMEAQLTSKNIALIRVVVLTGREEEAMRLYQKKSNWQLQANLEYICKIKKQSWACDVAWNLSFLQLWLKIPMYL